MHSSKIAHFLQGYEATAAALSFTCWMLSQHQDVQVRETKEVILERHYEQKALIAITLLIFRKEC
jgi:cytochrome P450